MNNKLQVINMPKNLYHAFNVHRVYRHIAYRRFVLWIWHKLGKGNRKVLPACVVSRIRQSFHLRLTLDFSTLALILKVVVQIWFGGW